MTTSLAPEKMVFTVSQLNRKAKQLLEIHLPLIWVSGELTNLAQPGSGHWYFSLKDDTAQVRCAMFKSANQRVRWRPESGQQVLVRARVSLYEGRGDYQLIIEHMEPAGAGALQQAYEALKKTLQSEGLFDDSHKRELPLFPKHIGVITSPTGAAIRDILSVLSRRYPIAPVTVIPVSVQGESAAPEMIAALKKAEAFKQLDVIIIGRGGGSMEDLWAFNNEALIRAIAACDIPIISAVGHEVDITLCDYVADVRAATPSASAEIATPDLDEWQQALDAWEQQLIQEQHRSIQQARQRLLALRQRLRHPKQQLHYQQQRLQQLHKQLRLATQQWLSQQQQQLNALHHRFQQQHPQKQLNLHRQQLNQQQQRQHRAIQQQLRNKRQQLLNATSLLNAVNPLEILNRGYSVTTNEAGEIIQKANQAPTNSLIHTRLSNGVIVSKVVNNTGSDA